MVAVAFRKAMDGGLMEKIIGIRSGLPGMVYSHSELYFYRTGRAYVVSASGIGWRERQYDSGWDLLTLPVDEEEEWALEDFCHQTDASEPRYDWPGLVYVGLLHLSGKQLPKWWFCSEQIAWALRKLGYVDLFFLEPESYTPALLAYAVRQWNLLTPPIRSAVQSRAKSHRGVRI